MSKFLNGFMKIPERWQQVHELRGIMATYAVNGEGCKDPSVMERLDFMKDKAERCFKYVCNPMVSAAFALDPEYHHVNIANIRGGEILRDLTSSTRVCSSTTATTLPLLSRRRRMKMAAARWAGQEVSSPVSEPEVAGHGARGVRAVDAPL